MSKNRYEFQIDGNNYVLKTVRSKEETDKIVKYVDDELKKAKQAVKYNNKAVYSTLACLNIADDLYDIVKEYNELKDISKEPLEKYQPLKEEFDLYVENHKEIDNQIIDLKEKIEKLNANLEKSESENEKYKLELERQQNQAKKSMEDNKTLRDRLLQQEQKTLQLKKQLQELLRNRK